MTFTYETDIGFLSSVGQHNILLRCLPAECEFQHVTDCRFTISEGFWHSQAKDSFGNNIIIGGTSERHRSLYYKCEGRVEHTVYCIPDASPDAMYSYPSPMTELSDADYAAFIAGSDAFVAGSADGKQFLECCISIMHGVHSFLKYEPGVTDVGTKVAQLMMNRKGVCQDFAHLMIAVCRRKGMMARYVCGLMQGEGVTHAWVEVHDGQCWYAFDPTNDTAIAHGYIKIAHGRDACDCPVSRGMFTGNTISTTDIKVVVN